VKFAKEKLFIQLCTIMLLHAVEHRLAIQETAWLRLLSAAGWAAVI